MLPGLSFVRLSGILRQSQSFQPLKTVFFGWGGICKISLPLSLGVAQKLFGEIYVTATDYLKDCICAVVLLLCE